MLAVTIRMSKCLRGFLGNLWHFTKRLPWVRDQPEWIVNTLPRKGDSSEMLILSTARQTSSFLFSDQRGTPRARMLSTVQAKGPTFSPSLFGEEQHILTTLQLPCEGCRYCVSPPARAVPRQTLAAWTQVCSKEAARFWRRLSQETITEWERSYLDKWGTAQLLAFVPGTQAVTSSGAKLPLFKPLSPHSTS